MPTIARFAQQAFDDALNDYESRCSDCITLGLKIESGGNVPYLYTGYAYDRPVTVVVPVLYTKYNIVLVPPNESLSFEVAQHEVGHVIRYRCNRDLSDFYNDAAKYGYVGVHSCESKKSEQFAFNEGWAYFWAGDCRRPKAYKKDTPGQVAQDLRNLQNGCGSTDKDMGDVLCNHRGEIHSLEEFKRFHRC